jgi:hypothetical protein
MFKKCLATILTVFIMFATSSVAMAKDYCYTGHSYVPCNQHSTAASKTKRVLEYGAFGAGAGYVLSGKHNRGTNVLKGLGIGAAAGLLTGR